jgi:hypothetical protein
MKSTIALLMNLITKGKMPNHPAVNPQMVAVPILIKRNWSENDEKRSSARRSD